jgi:mono/diheme cytochrome c family protein
MRALSPWSSTAFLAICALASALRAAPPAAPTITAGDLAFFETKIRPLLIDRCYQCHSKEADKVRGGLLLDSREALIHGGNTGSAVVPGKPNESLLIKAIRYADEDLQMPPKGEKLSDQQIADLTEWVRRGAPDPRTLVAKGSSPAYGGVGKNHWAFQPVKKPTLPAVQNSSWIKNPVDHFVLAKLEANGMTPNSPAEKTALIRRVYFDLIGLPPHPAEVQTFVRDTSPDAYTKLVDKLLATPQYGEHWGRYWLDIARYSDSKGDAKGQEDIRYPHAWTYRDWVIDAFNADLPYDKFIIAQLAGDYYARYLEKQPKPKNTSLPTRPPAKAKLEVSGEPVVEMAKVEVVADRDPGFRRMMAAEGFLTLGNQFNGRKDDIIGDQIDVTTKAFLGLTVACARCHDHKFDPIPTKDYYSLYGVFANSRQPVQLPTLQANPPQTPFLLDYLAKSAALDKRESDLKKERDEFQQAVRSAGGKSKATAKAAVAKVDPAKRQQLQRADRELSRDRNSLEAEHPGAPARANSLIDAPRSVDYPVLLRGEVANKGEMVPRRFLEILSPNPKKRVEWHDGSGRWQLALAIADPKNPLTARVMVNRLWQKHWGSGLVATPDDLGNMSAPPTHPELLDWLAATFVENKWSIKSLHRLILLSAAYQQSGANQPAFAEKDPNNQLLWRFNLRRLTFEELHDSLLAVSGELNLKYGGRPVDIGTTQFAKRRAVYTLIDRGNPPELLTQFDFPSPDVASGRRYETLVPQQALFLMNSPMVIETARKLVDRPTFAELKSDEERVTLLYLAIYQRWPTKPEVALGLRYVTENPTGTALALSSDSARAKITARDALPPPKKEQNAKKKGRYSVDVGGVYDAKPLDAWTKLAHALFQANEAIFYN